MLSLLPSAGSAVPSAVVVADHQRGPSNNPSSAHTAREQQPFYSNRVTGSGLCPHPNSMGGNSGPALPRIPPLIMPPLTTSTCNSSSSTTTAAAAATGDYSPPSPRLYPSPYSPAGVPYFAQSSTSSSSSSATSHHPHPSSPAAPSAHYYFPFTHPNPYSRHYIQIDPNYSAVALAASLQNPSAAAQLRPYPRPAPIFAVSPANPSSSPSPNQYSVFPFPPSHHLSLHPPPPMTPFTSSAVPSTSTSEHSSSLPLFGVAPNNSPVRLTSISPDDRSPSSVSPHSQISRHSSSPNVISAGGPKGGVVVAAATTAAVDVPHSSSTPTQPSVSFSAASISSSSRSLSCSSNGTGSAGGGGGRDLSLKHRLLIRPSVNSQQGHNQDVAQHHRHQLHHQHQRNAAFLNVNSCQLPSTSLPSNSIISHVNLDHVVNKLRSSTPKRSKSSSTSSSSTASSTSRPPSSQPPTTPSAVAAITHNNNPAVQPSNAAAAGNNSNSSVKLMYPAHFNKGSIIQLTGGELKCVEDLCTEDFVKSAEQSGNLQIDSSTVVRIDSVNNLGKNGSTVVLGFAVGVQKLQVSVEASLEHPFFVFGKGWSSCSPPRTLQRYSLPCHQLIVGDVCISLTHKQNYQRKTSASNVTIAADGCLDNRVISTASPINNLNTNVIPKTLYQRGTGAKRKRRWSESDANECRVLPKSDHSSGHDAAAAAASALRIQPPLNQSCK